VGRLGVIGASGCLPIWRSPSQIHQPTQAEKAPREAKALNTRIHTSSPSGNHSPLGAPFAHRHEASNGESGTSAIKGCPASLKTAFAGRGFQPTRQQRKMPGGISSGGRDLEGRKPIGLVHRLVGGEGISVPWPKAFNPSFHA